MAIPKQLHVIWIGDESRRPDAMIQSWQRMNPGYSLRVWGNRDLLQEPWKTMPQIKSWLTKEINGAADIMRWEILYRHGGVAVDADSRCVRPLEDWLLEPDCFAVWENEIVRPGLIACGAMGCIPGHPLIGQILMDILADQDICGKMAWEKVGPGRITGTVRTHQYSGITIYPSHYFIPRHFSGIQYKGSGPVFAVQEWGSTFGSHVQPAKQAEPQAPQPVIKDLYRATQEASVALAEGKSELAARLAADILRVDANNEPAGRLLSRAQHPPTAVPASTAKTAVLSRSAGGSFFLQRVKIAQSAARRLDVILPLVSGRRVLHVGCVDSPIFDPRNNLHLTLSKAASELHGLDIDAEGLEELRRHFDGVYFDDVEKCIQHGQHYDVVLVPETIEHVASAESFLQSLHRISFDTILVSAPCIYGWGRYGILSHRDSAGIYGPYGWLLNPGSLVEEVHPDHKYWFSPYTLANLIEAATPWKIESIYLLEDARQVAVLASHSRRASHPVVAETLVCDEPAPVAVGADAASAVGNL